MSNGFTEEECKELWKEKNIALKSCMGPGGINKSLAYVGGVNITLGMVVVAVGMYYYFTKMKKKGGNSGGNS